MGIGAWLRELGLERYEQAFHDHEITPAVLPQLADQDLKEIGISSLGHRKKLLEAIENLRSPSDVARGDRLLSEARDVISSGNNVARLFMLGAIVWWLANLLPYDLSEGAIGTPIERLDEFKELRKLKVHAK